MKEHLIELVDSEIMAHKEVNGHLQDGLEKLSEIHGKVLNDLDQSLWDMFHNTALISPQKVAVISIWQSKNHLKNLLGIYCSGDTEQLETHSGEEEVFEWTYEELVNAVETLSGWLSEQGCVEGEKIVSGSIMISIR